MTHLPKLSTAQFGIIPAFLLHEGGASSSIT